MSYFYGVGAAGAFNPANYGTVEWWYDASQITPQTDGTDLTQWDDLSGNARHLTSEATKYPLYKTNAINTNMPGVLWDGTNDYLRHNTAFTQNYQSSLFVVCKQTTAGSKILFIEGGTLYNSTAFGLYGDSGGSWIYKDSTYTGAGTNDWVTNAYNICEAHYSGAAEATFLRNGITQSNGVVTGSPATGSASRVLNVGARNGGASSFYQGYIFELFRYNAKLADADVVTVRNALATKWGIVI
jgi:hypothetical protein